MVNNDERLRLLRTIRPDSTWAFGTVVKCAAGLLILFGLALFGSVSDLQQDATRDARVKQASQRQTLSTPVAEAKAVFDERRWRFEAHVMRPSEVAER